MEKYILRFNEIDKSFLPYVGGKGANLGELTKADFPVPQGFCVTTAAYQAVIRTSKEMNKLFDLLEGVSHNDLDQINILGTRIREHIDSLLMPEDIKLNILEAWRVTGEEKAYAVRSSATAEDLPTVSFAGQQDTYLNVLGQEQLLKAVQNCWASLFTDRAISYRAKNGFKHRLVLLSVVVQQMVFPEVAGIMFTSDPITGHRKTITIDASFGLGEALVSGLVSADLYQVRSGQIIKKQISSKQVAIYSVPAGGTVTTDLPLDQQTRQALQDDLILELASMGQAIEAHYGAEQDIEWCWVEGKFYIVQSRPITSLYPVPRTSDHKLHLFLSFGHMQMMTEAMKPMGLSVLRTLVPVGKSSLQAESELMQEAGGRLFFDITNLLEYPVLRKRLPSLLGNVDELFGRAVQEFCERTEFKTAAQNGKRLSLAAVKRVSPTVLAVLRNILYRHNERALADLNRFIANSVQESSNRLQTVSGPARINLIQEMLPTLLSTALARVAPYIGAGIGTYRLIESYSKKWLGDAAELGNISKSPPGNVTTEMGLVLGDLADAVREHPAVIEYLQHATDATFWEDLRAVPGGEAVLPIFSGFFARYGMRGTGEIDVTRPRWRETPNQLLPTILNHLKGLKPGQHRLDFLKGQKEAELAAAKLLHRLRQTPWGQLKAKIMQRLIKVHRSVIGIREHPKYLIVQTLDLIKLALLQEAYQLVVTGILTVPEEIFWLSLPEIKELLVNQQLDRTIIARRKENFLHYAKLTPPRAITSEGEIITAKPGAQVPPGALAGSPVSAGTVEGRARVILRLEDADMEKGDILVAPYTDPAWTPLFSMAAGLITEVGGMMTHGSVIAREYGIPAVVGIEKATELIKDGTYIRVNGTEGYVELLDQILE
ncbi:MAG: phosphoenolpyruvate synthase [Desulfosporosinus sp.]|nr:phosphoenolpyruvate synthase [Desulfosporosinus sp.]